MLKSTFTLLLIAIPSLLFSCKQQGEEDGVNSASNSKIEQLDKITDIERVKLLEAKISFTKSDLIELSPQITGQDIPREHSKYFILIIEDKDEKYYFQQQEIKLK